MNHSSLALQSTAERGGEPLQAEIARLGPWFHNLHLPGGVQTAPDHWLGDFPHSYWKLLAAHLPADLSGWSVLDVGCNAGFYSIELARRGADVLGIDIDQRYLKQARWALGVYNLGDRVRLEQAQVHEIGRRGQCFDLVLFMGVFYHLRYPLLALDVVRRCTGRLMVFQSLTLAEDDPPAPDHDYALEERAALSRHGWPRMAFVEHRLQGDPTNWWVPNAPAVEAMLRSSGFRVLARPGHELWLCEPCAAADAELQAVNEAEYRAALALA